RDNTPRDEELGTVALEEVGYGVLAIVESIIGEPRAVQNVHDQPIRVEEPAMAADRFVLHFGAEPKRVAVSQDVDLSVVRIGGILGRVATVDPLPAAGLRVHAVPDELDDFGLLPDRLVEDAVERHFGSVDVPGPDDVDPVSNGLGRRCGDKPDHEPYKTQCRNCRLHVIPSMTQYDCVPGWL